MKGKLTIYQLLATDFRTKEGRRIKEELKNAKKYDYQYYRREKRKLQREYRKFKEKGKTSSGALTRQFQKVQKAENVEDISDKVEQAGPFEQSDTEGAGGKTEPGDILETDILGDLFVKASGINVKDLIDELAGYGNDTEKMLEFFGTLYSSADEMLQRNEAASLRSFLMQQAVEQGLDPSEQPPDYYPALEPFFTVEYRDQGIRVYPDA